MEIVGYLAAGLIGISLGLIGSGGSILTVPILVYCFHIEPAVATAYSLFIVGITAFAGSITNIKRKTIDLHAAVIFSIPSLVAVFLVRRFLLPAIPEDIMTLCPYVVTKDFMLMVLFGITMLTAGTSMIKRRGDSSEEVTNRQRFYPLLINGFFVGTLTGLLGMGGGFLIVPALVLLAKIPIKKAIGTSLLIIAVKSITGFIGDLDAGQPIDFVFIAIISALAIAGIYIGTYVSKFLDCNKLKLIFGGFVMFLSIGVLTHEITAFFNVI